MKQLISPVFILALVQFSSPPSFLKMGSAHEKSNIPLTPSENVFIITLDGFRWQEVFNGADSILLNDEKYTLDAETVKLLYWNNDTEIRRKKLMPFFWNVLAEKGQLYGNRLFENKVNVANHYAISYPGYNEMLTGNPDVLISSNKKINNSNINILEYLNSKPAFNGKVAAFTSWNVFPYIFNTDRNNLPVNSGYEGMEGKNSPYQKLINAVQEAAVTEKKQTRYDQLTFLMAKEYIQQHRPRLAFIGFGETDEHAHDGRYDLYLEKASLADKMIADLWHWVQTTPGYKDNTTFLITTDHGRGSHRGKWTTHGSFIKGSSQTWLGMMGPGISPTGEQMDEQQVFQAQLARTVADILGESFTPEAAIAPSISLR